MLFIISLSIQIQSPSFSNCSVSQEADKVSLALCFLIGLGQWKIELIIRGQENTELG